MNKHLIKDLNKYADMLAEGELISPDDLNCSAVMRLAAEALAQPEHSAPHGEPVAWMQDTTCGLYVIDHPDEWHCIPLYTTQPQRKPLTDEQLEKGRDQTFSINNPFCPCDSKTFRKVARWVEAAHGIKE